MKLLVRSPYESEPRELVDPVRVALASEGFCPFIEAHRDDQPQKLELQPDGMLRCPARDSVFSFEWIPDA